MIRGLIFDFDGLILDTETLEFHSWQEIFHQHGCEISQELWCAHIGARWDAFDPSGHLQDLLEYPIDRPAVKAVQRARFYAQLDRQPSCPGVVECLDAAQAHGLQVAVASSAPHAWVDRHLQRLGLFDCFTAVVCAEDAESPKPAPDLYLAALDALGLAVHEAIAFEDSPNGIRAARSAGIFCVAVPNAITRRLDLSQSDLQLDSLAAWPLERLLPAVEEHAAAVCSPI